MKIATYNVWNHEATWESRIQFIADEIARVNPDVIALQELPGHEEGERLAAMAKMPYYRFKAYPDEREGLGFLAKSPMREVPAESRELNECAYRIRFERDGLTFGVTNVHLDWRFASVREKQILAVTDWISGDAGTRHELLCGDFNSVPDVSSVYNFLIGEQSLQSKDAKWVDLAQRVPHPTLDFIRNTWLHNRDELNDARVPLRYDWMLLRACYPDKEPRLGRMELFGDSPVSGIFPSDHYGVAAELLV